MVWIYVILSVVVVSLISLVGVLTFSVKLERLKQIVLYLVSFSAGALLGDAFIHLLPQAAENAGFTLAVSLYVLSGIIISFVIEKAIHWRHCHIPTSSGHPHPFALMNLFGDAVHNFIDGLIIAASYIASIPVGIATTIAVILHEIPQEIGDFGVLVHGGFSRRKALYLNFLTALTAVLGAVIVLLFGSIAGLSDFLVPFAAGGFIYIAGSDLIPELHSRCFAGKESAGQLAMIILGILVMLSLILLE